MYWKQYVTRARVARSIAGKGHYRELRYESLIDDPERAVRELCPFLGFRSTTRGSGTLSDRCRPRQIVLQRTRLSLPPTRDEGDWCKELSPPQLALFETAAGDLL